MTTSKYHKKTHNLKEELQEKYLQYELLRQQLQAFVEEKQIIEQRIQELNVTIDALHKLDEVKKGGEIWSPLGSGSFVMSDIKDTENVMIALGAGIVSREKKERAIEILKGRMEDVTSLDLQITSEMQKIVSQLQKTEKELESISHKAQNE